MFEARLIQGKEKSWNNCEYSSVSCCTPRLSCYSSLFSTFSYVFSFSFDLIDFISSGSLFKKIVESIRELVTDANLECNESGISMQAMDSSHVSLCALQLKSEGFDHFRWDTFFEIKPKSIQYSPYNAFITYIPSQLISCLVNTLVIGRDSNFNFRCFL